MEPAGTEVEEGDIIGGFPSTGDRFQAVGAFLKERWGEYDVVCAGTLIAPDIAVTAQHCDLDESDFFAVGYDAIAPDQRVRVESFVHEDTVTGNRHDLGIDLAVAYLAEEIEGVEPARIGRLSHDDIGRNFIAVGYGIQNAHGDTGTRKMGEKTLRALEGNYIEVMTGADYEEFVARATEIMGQDVDDWPEDRLREFYEERELFEDHEASFGGSPGNAQACYIDSGGPIARVEDGDVVVYGTLHGGLHNEDGLCHLGAIYTVFGPVAEAFVERALACPGIPEEGRCDGDTLHYCREAAGGAREPAHVDCSAMGLRCGEDHVSGEMHCL